MSVVSDEKRDHLKTGEARNPTASGYATPLSYADHSTGGPSQARPRSSSRRILIIGVVAVVILALALGLGLGLGLKHHTATSTESASTPNATIALVGRDTLWNSSAYYLENSNFVVSATPQTRVFNWTISEVMATPAGFTKNMIVVNGQSPGPVVHANFGDRLIFNIRNNLSNETAVHWHGQLQNSTNFMDGTYSITQCGIPPGGIMSYDWTVQNVGTYWYHAHRSEQYTDGLYGALILHSPTETVVTTNTYPANNEVVLLLNDMYNTPAMALQWRFQALGTGIDGQPGDEPVPDGGLINGVGQGRCAYIPASDSVIAERKRSLGERSTTTGTFYPETNYCNDNTTVDYFNMTLVGNSTYRLRLINSGTFLPTRFSIDGHNLTVVEADGTAIQPVVVDGISIAVAQRYSVLVTLDQAPGAYWVRSQLDYGQATYTPPNSNDTTFGVLRYQGISQSLLPADEPAPSLNLTDVDYFSTLVPVVQQVVLKPTKSAMVTFDMQYVSSGQHYMFVNGSSWSALDPGQANIFQVTSNSSSFSLPESSQLNIVNDGIYTFDLVVNSLDDGTHPFHLHGHAFQIISQGASGFYGDTSTLNATNPMVRDTIVIDAYGHAVLRFVTDNPGVWAFHCHIGWHMSIGLLMTFTDLPRQIPDLAVPTAVKQMCTVDATLGS